MARSLLLAACALLSAQALRAPRVPQLATAMRGEAAARPRRRPFIFSTGARLVGTRPSRARPGRRRRRSPQVALVEEGFASLRPPDAASFECSIPELRSVCRGDDICDVSDTVRERFLEWLESNDAAHVHDKNIGQRIFRYDGASDTVAMDYYGPGGDLRSESWPWDDAFYALYEWDMMC